MKFNIRRIDGFALVTVGINNSIMDIGLLDDKERIALADELQEAIDDLLYGLPEQTPEGTHD